MAYLIAIAAIAIGGLGMWLVERKKGFVYKLAEVAFVVIGLFGWLGMIAAILPAGCVGTSDDCHQEFDKQGAYTVCR